MKPVRVFFAAIVVLLFCQVVFATPGKILLKTGAIDPTTARRAPIDKPDTDYYIVQFMGPIIDEWEDQALSCGVELLDYLPEFAFIARADGESLRKLSLLPFVSWIGDFLPEYKLSPDLSKVNKHVRITVQAFPGEAAHRLAWAVVEAGGTVETGEDCKRSIVRAKIHTQALTSLAKNKNIAWIEPYVEPRLHNKVSRAIINTTSVWQDLGFYGNGQIVVVSDTGLDNGKNDTTMSADFRGRILNAYALGRTNDWSDPNAHGTHVCGSVLGNGSLSGANPNLHSYANSHAGMAPEAGLVMQSILDPSGGLGGLPSSLYNLFSPVYTTDNARIHTNSWGAPNNGVYSSYSQQVDQFTWDYKDMTVLFSAGNAGIDSNSDGVVDLDSIDDPGTAKNCITVGATESNISANAFTYGGAWPTDYPVSPLYGDLVANNTAGMAAFSSRGPTNDGRIKPDICAPGTNIISARSHKSGSGALWGVYSTDYLYSGGTSMSTPIVAGAAALLRQFLVNVKGVTSPSSALIKALLLNSATDINPGQYGSGTTREIPSARPNNVEGWGRLEIRNAIQPNAPANVAFTDFSTGLKTGESAQYTYNITNTTVPLKVTLVWTDYPGTLQASKKLVNDLDLVITAPGGQQYRGNGTTDRTNNVETVDIAAPVAGTYTVTVTGYSVAKPVKGRQPYALAVMGGFGEAPQTTQTMQAAKSKPDNTLIWISGKVVTAGTEALGDHFYIEEPDRSSGIKIAYTGGTVPTGSMVYIQGRLAGSGDERQITAEQVAVLSTNNTLPAPFGLSTRDIGGLGVGTQKGAPNVGLLVKVWGRVKPGGTDTIVLDDGNSQVTVKTGTLTKPALDSYASVTGISSMSGSAPLIKARFQSDIKIY